MGPGEPNNASAGEDYGIYQNNAWNDGHSGSVSGLGSKAHYILEIPENLINISGCDSTAILNLTINSSDSTSSSETACDSYTWDGVVYTTMERIVIHIPMHRVVICTYIHLTINNSNTGISSVTACDSYTWDGVVYTTSGTYSNTYTNASGCDSVHTH